MEDRSNKSVVEFMGMRGKHVTVDMNHVEYIQEAKAMDKSCTLICFSSGKKMFVDAKYALVRDLLSIFRTGKPV
jgi:hypothetical protein